ncbi:MAG: 2,3-bisphosphoglycerate-independent phosphoglycerate mutase [Anaerolineae bacterium]|nr:2,3-bisphosphoglycerate-independent phosphoglycerate mutase [Anaerolineae bacterium]
MADDFDLYRELTTTATTKIVLLVMDGLGGLPMQPGGPTELEAANTPNLDKLAEQSSLGLSHPVGPGIAPGSGPGHLGLFGYDPITYPVGRGVLEAVGIGMEIGPNDLALRGNFCTVDNEGHIIDRRAGRIPTEEGAKRVALLKQIKLPDVETTVEAVQDYRFCLRLRGEGLSDRLTETDPQAVGVPPLPVTALAPEATRTARLLNDWVAQARVILHDHPPANMVTLRGPSADPSLPKYADVFKLRAAAIAVYPMYRGVASLVGMDVLKPFPKNLDDELAMARAKWADYDFFFIHVKYTDSRGEDGNFEAKCKIIEEVDSRLPDLLALNPDVLVITGDHSTPALLRQHSWHPVPLLLWSKTCRPDGIARFGERPCAQGGLGHIPARHILPLALAHAMRMKKYGA